MKAMAVLACVVGLAGCAMGGRPRPCRLMSKRRKLRCRIRPFLAAVLFCLTLAATMPAAAQTPVFACSELAPPFGGVPEDETGLFLAVPGGSIIAGVTSPAGDASPAWAPNFERLAFHSLRSGRYEIWTVSRDGGGLAQLTVGGGKGPAWAPDGSRIVFARDGNIWVVDADSRNARAVTATGTAQEPRFTPDGRIVYTDSDGAHNAIYVMYADGSGVQRLTYPVFPNFPDANAAAPSPDGRFLAYFAGNEPGGSGEIWLTNVDGSDARRLTYCVGYCTSDQPSWDPLGQWILFGRAQDGVFTTRIIAPAGGGEEIVLPYLCADGRQPWGY